MEKITFKIDENVREYCKQNINKFLDDLRNNSNDNLYRTVHELQEFLNNDLQALSNDGIMFFLEELSLKIFDLLRNNVFEKKGLILAIIVLVYVDIGNASIRRSRFANLLSTLSLNDIDTIELTAYAIGKIALTSGPNTIEYVDYEIKKAVEGLKTEKNEFKKKFYLFILRELAISTPTYFYQHLKNFFDIIFNLLLKEPNKTIQDVSIITLRSVFYVISSREVKMQSNKESWYRKCFDEVISVYKQLQNFSFKEKYTRENTCYGILSILNELLRISNLKDEKMRQDAEELSQNNLIQEPIHSKYQVFKEWGANSLSKGLKSLSFTTNSSNLVINKNSFISNKNYKNSVLSAASLYSRKIPLCESMICRNLINEKFDEICELILNMQSFKSNHVQFVFFLLLPRLAAFKIDQFSYLYLSITMKIYFQAFKKEKLQPFLSFGLIAYTVKDKIQPYLKEIIEILKYNLISVKEKHDVNSNRKKHFTINNPSIYICIGLIAKSLKSGAKNEIKSLIDLMFANGISSALASSLFEISNQIPSLKNDIQDGLFKMLNEILSQKQSFVLTNRNTNLINHQEDNVPNVNSIILALKILSQYDFEKDCLIQFLLTCSDVHLKSENREIKFETVKCCCFLLTRLIQKLSLDNTLNSNLTITLVDSSHDLNFSRTIKNVLQKLLVLSVSDEDPNIRYTVLESLNEQYFDIELAQPENLNLLLISLKDEIFEIRELSIAVVARLSSINPTYVMPSLRELIMELLTDLQYSGTNKNKEISSKMLCQLIENAPCVIRPYSPIIMNVFVKTFENTQKSNLSNNNVSISILSAIGSLAQVSGLEMKTYFDELYPSLLNIIQDVTFSCIKEIALWCLGKLISTTGCILKPYSRYNELYECLLNLLKIEHSTLMRREIIRVLGLLGVIDPFKHKLNVGLIDLSGDIISAENQKVNSIQEMNSTNLLVEKLPNYNEFYPAIAIANLIKIIKDPNLVSYHIIAIRAVTFIFDHLKLECVPFISDVIPSYIAVIKSSEANLREFLFQQLCKLVNITQKHIKDYLEDIFLLIKQYWSQNQEALINLVEEIAFALDNEFEVYVPRLLPYILTIFTQDNSSDRLITIKTLKVIRKLSNKLDTYIHIILRPLIKLFDNKKNSFLLQKEALDTLIYLSQSYNLSKSFSLIIYPLIRTIDNSPKLRDSALNLLCILVIQMGYIYLPFIPTVDKVLKKHNLNYQKYDILLERLANGEFILFFLENDEMMEKLFKYHKESISKDKKKFDLEQNCSNKNDVIQHSSFKINFHEIDRIFLIENNFSKEDWIKWLNEFTFLLLKESPSIALRACNSLAQEYNQVSKDLFNCSFISCWNQFDNFYREELIKIIEKALLIDSVPEIGTTILNLVEFMEHSDKEFPINSKLISEKAFQCLAYAKALHFIENQFRENPTDEVLELLISVNNKLKQSDAATGVIKYINAHKNKYFNINERWYEKLHDWENALNSYKIKLNQNPNDFESLLGQMRSLEALGEWENLQDLIIENWYELNDYQKEKMATISASCAWNLSKWEDMEVYCKSINKETSDFTFYQAIIAINKQDFKFSQKMIDKSRELIDFHLTAMISESRERAYGAMVQVMLLSELEEVIQFKLVPERREIIKNKWWNRLKKSQKITEDWQKILRVHSLVLKPQDDRRGWLKLASICEHVGNKNLSRKIFAMLFNVDIKDLNEINFSVSSNHIDVTYGYIKHLWRSGLQTKALKQLESFSTHLQEEENLVKYNILHLVDLEDHKEFNKIKKLLNKCYLKLAIWKEEEEGLTEKSLPSIMECYTIAARRDELSYKAWHALAFINYKALLMIKKKTQDRNSYKLQESSENIQILNQKSPSFNLSFSINDYSIRAVHGFFKSISLCDGNSLQDTLRLLTVIFEENISNSVYEAFIENLKIVSVETWLQVIPQLIARLESSKNLVLKIIHQILVEIGIHHPQALIYPLTVAQKSLIFERQNAAAKVISSMREHSNNLVNQALLVNEELIRVSNLWHEMWYKSIEDAYFCYFNQNDEKSMIDILDNLFSTFSKPPVTLNELAFKVSFSRELNQAKEFYDIWKKNRDFIYLGQTWKLFYNVFLRLSIQKTAEISYDLQYISPKLFLFRNFELAVPGNYNPSKQIIRISSIDRTLKAIVSKHKPKMLSIKSDNGQIFKFLLKSREDLRQDERVIQLFGLVNTLLANNYETRQSNLSIQRYAVVPLSRDSGLISWVPDCDTFHFLIKSYRIKKNIHTDLEWRFMLKKAPYFDKLKLMQKVEVFEHALENTNGEDLRFIFWEKSPNSEIWLERRTNYIRSFAVMSIVGYILGLGDRHPANLMLHRLTGKVLHIDLGDCFEVALNRENYPETVPFRLTRMFINAMEVTGIDGTYRLTCEKVMKVLRLNKDSLMAVLEAFVYDPLLNWDINKSNYNTCSFKSSIETFSQVNIHRSDQMENLLYETDNFRLLRDTIENLTEFDRKNKPILNKKAVEIVNRISDKLTGKDFNPNQTLDVENQVNLLIKQATSNENLSRLYLGWSPFW